ncbi:hypothetical protein AQUCO_00200361v1 [Aquilegia coerulea]|uniref:Helicase ATP-binding domain-containing protein n=1 Tax=Aquilegia coerulea TaxID=218851 RepID=A0A2G5F2U3_AQUCA|nr:hypothetical protein AQUCO_00200361v1 [Aquilegia coerulea]PIA62312.1 hypothetical protein AQUCO_00200361v1 [Aquilegia coerulea]
MQFLSPSLLNTSPLIPFFSKHTLTLLHHSNPNYQKLGFHFPNFNLSRSSSILNVSSNSISPLERNYIEEEDEDDDDDEYEAAEEYDEFVSEDLDVNEEDDEAEEEEIDSDIVVSSSRFEEHKWQRIERIRNEVKEYGEGIIDLNELSSIYDFRIDKFQRLAIEAFLRGSSVVVSAPTSSGKTLIAEAAAVATVAKGRRIFYTTPLKALSNQKYREFREAFGESNVGLLTGDSAVNKDAQVLIMTTEILRNMLYQSVGMVSSGSGLFSVDVIVLDEVHYLSDISRGTVWEEIVIYCPKKVQLICLSATVANADELAGWIGQIHGTAELVTSSKRPVPLTWHFSMKNSMVPLLNEKGTSMNKRLSLDYMQNSSMVVKPHQEYGSRRRNFRKRVNEKSYNSVPNMSGQSPLSKHDLNAIRRSKVPQVIDTLRHLKAKDMLPAIWFIFSRKGCDAAVQYIGDGNLLDECELVEVELALKRFRVQYPDAVREAGVKGLLQGVAAHHAGCLPLWKSFIEQLFQKGLVKVVFATETLAAGINMPARTAVVTSLSKRGETGRINLRSNELLQMAGRAGRRGIDKRGHVVLVQTPYEGAEEGCKLLFGGIEPLVSQFTASYGMVLNLLAGAKVTRRLKEKDDMKNIQAGRTLEEAKKLVEKSFGNYVGSSVMLAAKEELSKIQEEIGFLTLEVSDDAVDKKSRKQLSEKAYEEISNLQEQLRAEKRLRTKLRLKMEVTRIDSLKPLLKELEDGCLPFTCLQYKDNEGVEHLVSAVYLGKVDSLSGSNVKNMINVDESFELLETELDGGDDDEHHNAKPSYHVALGSDNSWYLFTEKWIRTVYSIGLPNVPLAQGDALPREIIWRLLDKEQRQWDKLADSEFGGLWCMEGSLETWTWSLNVPVLNSLSSDNEMLPTSQTYLGAVECYKEQRNKVSRLRKKITRTEGFKEYKMIIDMTNFTKEKIERLKARSTRLVNRIEQIEPSGWKEFLQISQVIHEARALDINTHMIFPLGETAAAIRGENELWLAIVLRNKILLDLKPAQLAGFCGSLVSEGIKIRPWKTDSYIYEPSRTVINIIDLFDEQRSSFLQLQEKHGVKISCGLDGQFSGMVEAWASGLTWREIMMDCAMDEGDLARLLRRTIDLLSQIPKLPDIHPVLQNNAIMASNVMDRPPISELAG